MAKLAHRAEQYAQDVRSGNIIACLYVQQAVERYYDDLANALDRGWHFDTKAAQRVINFMERLKHTKGELAGKHLRLEPWQCFVVWNIFGWKNADGTRRFKYAYIDVARKNGKTTWSAGIALFMLFADGEDRAEVYSAATTKDQAKLSFDDATAMVRNSDLKNHLRLMRNAITFEPKGGVFKALSADYGTHDGLSPSCCIIDEFHAHKDSGLFDVLKSASGARRQPLMFIITTAGYNKSGVCYSYRDNVMKVLSGVNRDDSLFGIIYTLDDKAEWDQPQYWIKANPNLGVSCYVEYLEQQVLDAKNRAEAVRNVMTKNVNMWVDAATTWILDSDWMACCGDTPIEDLEGCDCWGGLDLSSVSDITALVLMFNEGGKYQLLMRCWIPEATMLERIRTQNINYDKWVAEDYVQVTPGNVIDYDYIKADIMNLMEKYNILSVAYDRYNSSQIIINLTNEGIVCSPFGQGFVSMNTPTKQLQVLIMSGVIEHFGNPVLRWMINSTAVETDAAGNIKPSKRISTQKIDGVVSSVMALGEHITTTAADGEFAYSSRGLIGD